MFGSQIPEIERFQYTVTIVRERCKVCKGKGTTSDYDDYGSWKTWTCYECHGTGQIGREEKRSPLRRVRLKPKKHKRS